MSWISLAIHIYSKTRNSSKYASVGVRTLCLATLTVRETAGNIITEIDFFDLLANTTSAVFLVLNFDSCLHLLFKVTLICFSFLKVV